MRFSGFLAFSSILAFAFPAYADHGVPHGAEWGYSGETAAAYWGELDEAYHACANGLKQSPINIDQFLKGELPDIAFDYKDIPLKVTNTGPGVQVNVPPGSKATIDGRVYELAQFHFHTPSEHYMDGSPYPMEGHFVHKDEKGALAVIGVMMKLGKENETIGKIWANIPAESGTEMAAEEPGAVISAYDLLPAQPGHYTYEGSLTIPPCTEGVTWLVMQQPIEISQEQLTGFQSTFPHNARPLQMLNDRVLKGD